jgi:small subunit ribosomal protein S20
MPIIKSAQKRMRQEKVKHERNLMTKRNLKNKTKAFEAAILTGKSADIITAQNELNSAFDVAAKKNVIHKNKASRKKATFAAKAKAAGAKPTASVKKAAPAKPAAKKTVAKKPVTKKTPAKKTTATKAKK